LNGEGGKEMEGRRRKKRKEGKKRRKGRKEGRKEEGRAKECLESVTSWRTLPLTLHFNIFTRTEIEFKIKNILKLYLKTSALDIRTLIH
jgi:hypothetical protein